MDTTLSHLSTLEAHQQLSIAEYVVGRSRQPDAGIAPVAVDELLETELAVVAWEGTEFAGFMRAKNTIETSPSGFQYRQIGMLVVAEQFQGMGLSRVLIEDVTQFVIEDQVIPYAFSSPASQHSFLRCGYTVALPGELDAFGQSMFGNEGMVLPYSQIEEAQEIISY